MNLCRRTGVYMAFLCVCFSFMSLTSGDGNLGEDNTTDVAVTGEASGIGVSSVTIGGYVNLDQAMLLLLKEFGVEYSIYSDFRSSSVVKVNGYSNREFSVYINGLKPKTKYYYRTYVQSLSEMYFYGTTEAFTTNRVTISVTPSYTMAKISPDDATYESFTLYYSTKADRDFVKYCYIDDSGNVESNMCWDGYVKGLKPGTTYYFYLTNSNGSTDVQSFTTKQLPFSLSNISANYSNKPVYDSYTNQYGSVIDLKWLGSTYTVNINSDRGNQLRYGVLGIKNRNKSIDFDVYKTDTNWLSYTSSTSSPYVIEQIVWAEDDAYGLSIDNIKFLLNLVKSGNATSEDYSELGMLLDNLNTYTYELQAFIEYEGEQIYLDTPYSESQTSSPSPTSISLNYNSEDLEVGGTRQLSATVLPSGSSQNVTWSVYSGSSYVSVSSTGLVTAKAAGTAVVRATSTVDNSIYKDCTFNVKEAVSSIQAGSWSGNTLTIDANVSLTNEVPYNNYYRYASTQLLYTPTEIGKSGTITSIAFKVANASSFSTSIVKVYMGHKSNTFSDASDFVPSSNLTLVYSGTPTLGQSTGWETLTFNQGSFNYNGRDNLVVVVVRQSSSYTSKLKYYCYDTGNGYTLYRRSDNETGYADVTNTSDKYRTTTERPAVRMVVTTSQTSPVISFADRKVKAICVALWDTDGDGELSKDEAAAVKDQGSTFSNEYLIKTFDELEYFTGLTSIGEYAFSECSSLTSITIPNSVYNIGEKAFNGCTSLTSVDIPNSVAFIRDGAFKDCSSLASVTIQFTTWPCPERNGK